MVALAPALPTSTPCMIKLISWNLLRLTGASLDDVVRLIRREDPDLLLMQEATQEMDGLAKRVGGQYQRNQMPGRVHGLAVWSPVPLPSRPAVLPLQAGAMFNRVCQIIDLGSITIANVHLSHGQILNRRQLRRIAKTLPHRAAVIGDYNLIGPALLPGFRDVGPREPTHVAGDVVPLRIDRCLIRGVACLEAKALLREASDHRPIVLGLAVAAPHHAAEPASAVALGVVA
jgi:endonuclease/exonuclease/phosphatase (EEP) superfamily protein YafD